MQSSGEELWLVEEESRLTVWCVCVCVRLCVCTCVCAHVFTGEEYLSLYKL